MIGFKRLNFLVKGLTVLVLLTGTSFAGEWKFTPAPDIILNAGVIIPEDGGAGKNDQVGVSAGVMANFLTVEGVGNSTFSKLQLMSVGVAMQESGKFNLELSPISVKTLSGLTYGITVQPKKEDRRGGTVKLFIGITF